MNEAKHTKTPWAFMDNETFSGEIRSCEGFELIAVMPPADDRTADFQFIINACNVHDELLEAMKELMCWEGLGTAQEQGCKCETLGEALELCRAIIAKAEGRA